MYRTETDGMQLAQQVCAHQLATTGRELRKLLRMSVGG